MQHIDTTSYSTSSAVTLSVIALTYMNINGQVTVTEPQGCIKEERTDFNAFLIAWKILIPLRILHLVGQAYRL